MMDRLRNKTITVKKHGDVMQVRLFSCYGGRSEYLRVEARVNNKKEMDELMQLLVAKGVVFEKGTGWFK